MKISAIDIRKHTFEKIFRGYDPDEVDAFLNSLSQEWERFSSENNLLKMQLEYSEKELGKLKDIESTLFRTLKTAEDTSKLIEKEANESAEKRIEESKLTASDLVTEAEARTNQIIKETEERLRRFREEFISEIKIQERDFRAVENFRDNLIVQLSSLANSALETVEHFEGKYDRESVLNKMDEIKQHVAEIEIPKKGQVLLPIKEEQLEASSMNGEFKNDRPAVPLEVYEAANPGFDANKTTEIAVDEVRGGKMKEVSPALVVAPPVNEKPVATRTAADEMNEALVEMHKAAEKARDAQTREAQARDAQAGVNKFRPQETTPPKKPAGGGSFFDQI
jgi:cell division initiation protein